jgi:GTPase SAR1 family protein
MDNWHSEVKSQSEPDALCFLIGNQKDNENQREVGIDKAEKFKQIKELDFFAETSAKTGENVTETFVNIAKLLYQKNI